VTIRPALILYLVIILFLITTLAACTGASTPTAPSGPISARISEIDGMEQVYVPAGGFLMGTTSADLDQTLQECDNCSRDWFKDEFPQHKVYLDAFWIDKTEVTNAMFTQFVAETSYQTDADKAGTAIIFNLLSEDWKKIKGANWQHPRGPTTDIDGLDNHPVVQMSHNDARAYCEWAGRRLPTEAEWEKAARGTDGRIYPWGNQPPAGNLLNFADRNLNIREGDNSEDDGYLFTAPVGSYPDGASPYGVLDMVGNVGEQVADWYSNTYYASSSARNPTGPSSGNYFVIRGSSWSRAGWHIRSVSRVTFTPEKRSNGVGFRCAASP
jgi:formylglycine-generating enzyme required for sulfatase activity